MIKRSLFGQITQNRIAALFLIPLMGCASSAGVQKDFTGDAKIYIQKREWEKAYRTLEDALGSSEAATRLSAYDLIAANPHIKDAARQTFSAAALSRTFSAYDPVTASGLENVRLQWYAKFASDAELLEAQSNIDVALNEANRKRASLVDARRSGPNDLIVDDSVFGQLTEGDRIKFKAMYPTMQVIPHDSVGIIRTHQVIDKSTLGSSAGAQLGSAVAQAAYIDRSFGNRNYSALGQLSAGMLGALIGSTLNTSPQSRYLINYGVELRDGTMKGVLKLSSDGIAAPAGQCVFSGDIEEAPRYLCNDSIAAFIARAKRQAPAINVIEAGKPRDLVNCKIDGIGALRLSEADCRKSNGAVAP